MCPSWIREHEMELVMTEEGWFLKFPICFKNYYDVHSGDRIFLEQYSDGVFYHMLFDGSDFCVKSCVGERLLNFSVKILGNFFS